MAAARRVSFTVLYGGKDHVASVQGAEALTWCLVDAVMKAVLDAWQVIGSWRIACWFGTFLENEGNSAGVSRRTVLYLGLGTG
jgi:hypothetical protein